MKSNSSVFEDVDSRKSIEKKLKSFLNSQSDFLSPKTIDSPRAVGDAIQTLLSENFERILGSMVGDYSASFARRAMADLAFYDKSKNYYVVDVKTHRLDTKFNMPNLVSVERLARFYEEDSNFFVILKVDYELSDNNLVVKEVLFTPIESLNWDCLTIGALGWGQIQIANANIIKLESRIERKKWMLALCDTLLEFYPREIGKIEDRINHFKKLRDQWMKR